MEEKTVKSLIDLQEEFGEIAKEIVKELETRTLWDAHPASFFHSTAHKLKCFIEDASEKILLFKGYNFKQIKIWKLYWLEREKGKEPIGRMLWKKEFQTSSSEKWELLKMGISKGIEGAILNKIKETDNTFDDKVVSFYMSLADLSKGEYDIDIICEIRILKDEKEELLLNPEDYFWSLILVSFSSLLTTLYDSIRSKLTSLSTSYLVGTSFLEESKLFEQVVGKIRSIFDLRSKNPQKAKLINILLMFYEAKGGFLFYPFFETRNISELIKKRERKLLSAIRKVNENKLTDISELEEYLDDSVKILSSIMKGNGDKQHLKSLIVGWWLCSNNKDRPGFSLAESQTKKNFIKAVEKISELLSEIKNYQYPENLLIYLLTYPTGFLKTFFDELARYSQPQQNGKPIAYQELGDGVAGRVCRNRMGELIPSQILEKDLELDRRDKLYYFIMGLLEYAFDIGGSRASAVVVPLLGKGQLLGCVVVNLAPDDGQLTRQDFEIFDSISGLIGNIVQETKDKYLLLDLIKCWKKIGGKYEVYEDYIEEFRQRLPFIMNCLISRGKEAIIISEEKKKEMGKEYYVGTSKNMDHYEECHIVNKHTVHFVEFVPKGGSEPLIAKKEEVIAYSRECIKVALYIPAYSEVPGKTKGSAYILMISLDEPEEIFLAHKDELETFLNYCIGLTGTQLTEPPTLLQVQGKLGTLSSDVSKCKGRADRGDRYKECEKILSQLKPLKTLEDQALTELGNIFDDLNSLSRAKCVPKCYELLGQIKDKYCNIID